MFFKPAIIGNSVKASTGIQLVASEWVGYSVDGVVFSVSPRLCGEFFRLNESRLNARHAGDDCRSVLFSDCISLLQQISGQESCRAGRQPRDAGPYHV